MSFDTARVGAHAWERSQGSSVARRARGYFASDAGRAIQTALGLIWLLDGALQFQSFMYGRGFTRMLEAMIPGQPRWLGSSIHWAVGIAGSDLTVFNTLFALTQVLIGLGLLWRPTVRRALAVSAVWALAVWWVGEGFGMLFMDMASPLTGAPGAVALYALVGAIAWPSARPGGLLGERGTRIAWAALWLVMAWLWLLGQNSAPGSIHDAIVAAPSGMSWLSTVQLWVAGLVAGAGLPIALALALASAVIGVGVALRWRTRELLVASIVLNLAYWVLGQGFGGMFEGGATDPNAGPLFVLLAWAVWPR